jgi:putative zinc finger/helix-turn-helix YgiT family protein
MEETMKCPECGAAMKSARETVKYDDAMPGVTLVGVKVNRCPSCGEYEVEIPNLAALHRTLATAIVSNPARLDQNEIRFLRKFLGWSGSDFAAKIGASPGTVSRWENGKESMGPGNERALRLMVVHEARVEDYSLDSLAEIEKEPPRRAPKVRIELGRKGWSAEAAA